MQDFHHLKVWQKSHQVVLGLYKLTAKFPTDELYALTSQIRRAAVSIPANIAEGCARGGDAEFGRFLRIAQGSASELDYHLLLARDLKFVSVADYDCIAADLGEVRRMLTIFIQKLRSPKSYASTQAVPIVRDSVAPRMRRSVKRKRTHR